MMKGQTTVEFLFAFLASILMLSVLSAAVLTHKDKIKEKSGDIEHIIAAESAARAVETALNAGIEFNFDFSKENISYSAEEDRFLVHYKGKTIEIGGVFSYEDSEPI